MSVEARQWHPTICCGNLDFTIITIALDVSVASGCTTWINIRAKITGRGDPWLVFKRLSFQKLDDHRSPWYLPKRKAQLVQDIYF